MGPTGRRDTADADMACEDIPVRKRVFDLVCVVVGMLPAMLLTLVLGVLLWCETRTWPFIAQTRLTASGRRFRMYKLRTLLRAPPSRKRPAVFAIEWCGGRCNGRIHWTTRLSMRLRETHLDELPQLLNVARVEMSLVGPRPLTPWEHHRWRSGATLEPRCVAGVTCAYELFRSRGDNPTRRSHWDRWYTRHQSIWLDIWILVHTAKMALRNLVSSRTNGGCCHKRGGTRLWLLKMPSRRKRTDQAES